jgi:predicted P-loop ATPase
MPVLEGEQGTGKSTALRYLFGDRFFIDHLPDFHSKDSFQQLQGAWCVEVAELSALSKADVKDVKQFLSRLVDKFRPPFGRLPIQVPRRSVFWGTVNPEEGGYLRDPTGARRFWPIETKRIDTDAILRDRDQLWAEAVPRSSLARSGIWTTTTTSPTRRPSKPSAAKSIRGSRCWKRGCGPKSISR